MYPSWSPAAKPSILAINTHSRASASHCSTSTLPASVPASSL